MVVRGIVKSGETRAVIYNDPLSGSRSKVLLRFNGGVDWRMPILFRRSAHRPRAVLQQPVGAPFDVSY
jgi:hypothetical protein